MSVHLGGGWHIVHVTDRVVEIQKDDVAYRRMIGRDGYVRVRAEPGMDKAAMIEKARTLAQKNDEMLADRVARQIVLRSTGRYQQRQRELASAFATPEDPEIIGVRRP
jgi:hypothetical protein